MVRVLFSCNKVLMLLSDPIPPVPSAPPVPKITAAVNIARGSMISNGHLRMKVVATYGEHLWCEVISNNHHKGEMLTFRRRDVRVISQ